jgi:hypothetical protein
MTKKKTRKVKVVKVTTLEPDKHLVELEVHGAPAPPAEPVPAEPIELIEEGPADHDRGLEPIEQSAPVPTENSWLKWLKSLWN